MEPDGHSRSMFISFHTSMPSAPAPASSPTNVAYVGKLPEVAYCASPSTLSRTLKPFPRASVIKLKKSLAFELGAQRTWRFTHVMPAYCMRSGRENAATCPPNSKPEGEPDVVGIAVGVLVGVEPGAAVAGTGVAVAAGLPPPPPGIFNTCPLRMTAEVNPLRC